MARIRSDGARVFDPRRHYLVVVTAESLVRRPLTVPIFEISGGRRGRSVALDSAEGRRVVRDGVNVLYAGATDERGMPLCNVPLRDVLEGLLAGEVDEDLRESLRAHLAALTARGAAA